MIHRVIYNKTPLKKPNLIRGKLPVQSYKWQTLYHNNFNDNTSQDCLINA